MAAPPDVNPLRYKATLPSSQIGYVNALVESYEGMCIMRTCDPKKGQVEFWVSREFLGDFDRFIDGLREEMPVSIAPGDPEDWSDFIERGFIRR